MEQSSSTTTKGILPKHSNQEINDFIAAWKKDPSKYTSELVKYGLEYNNWEKYKSNIVKLNQQIYSLTKENDFDLYQCLSCIYGAFLGDAIGSYCEFTMYSKSNREKIFNGNNIFGHPPGRITDDSEMAMSMAFGIWDGDDCGKWDQNLLFYYYGFWSKSKPKDIGNTTKNALKFFYLNESHIENPTLFAEKKKIISRLNDTSLSNGFLMRISPFVVWYYYMNKAFVKDGISSNNDETYYELYQKIKENAIKDNEIIHSNKEVFSATACFTFIAWTAILGYSSNEIITKLKTLINNPKMSIDKYDKIIVTIVNQTLFDFESPKFDAELFHKTISAQSIGYYLHSFKLTLYFLVFFKNYPNYYDAIATICDCGGDTDTNAAIVGCVLGPLYGMRNFGAKEMNYLLQSVTDRYIYSPSWMYVYVRYLNDKEYLDKDDTNGEQLNNGIRFNVIKMLRLMLEIEI